MAEPRVARNAPPQVARTQRNLGDAVFLDHIHTPALLRARSARLFGWIAEGKLRVRIGGEYPLVDTATAHADMESRKATGKLLLVP